MKIWRNGWKSYLQRALHTSKNFYHLIAWVRKDVEEVKCEKGFKTINVVVVMEEENDTS